MQLSIKYHDNYDSFNRELMKQKKARLTEESMQYEDLAVLDNFSEDEITFALDRANIKGRKDKSALKKSKILKQQVTEMKQFQIEGMKALVDTINSIDENSKKILFKHFDQNNVNIMQKKTPDLLHKINKLTQEAEDSEGKFMNSDDMQSESSGN